jgi:hypothetical protein
MWIYNVPLLTFTHTNHRHEKKIWVDGDDFNMEKNTPLVSVDLRHANNLQLVAHYIRVLAELERRGINRESLTVEESRSTLITQRRGRNARKASPDGSPQRREKSPKMSLCEAMSKGSSSRLDLPLQTKRNDWGYAARAIKEMNNSSQEKTRTVEVYTSADVSKQFIKRALNVDHECVKEVVAIKEKGNEDEESGEDTDHFCVLLCSRSWCNTWKPSSFDYRDVEINVTPSRLQLRSREDLDCELDDYMGRE